MRRFVFFALVAMFTVTALAHTKPRLYLDRGEKNFVRLDHAPIAEIGTKGVGVTPSSEQPAEQQQVGSTVGEESISLGEAARRTRTKKQKAE
jgi:hypothetical protein